MIRAKFFVVGTPVNQGHHAVSRQGRVYDSNKKLRPWRAAVAAEAFVARQRLAGPLLGPLALTCTFLFPRPKRPKNPYPRQDIDSLTRALNDGLVEGGLVGDDRQVTTLRAVRKRWADGAGRAGCSVELADDEELVR